MQGLYELKNGALANIGEYPLSELRYACDSSKSTCR